jgi:homoserine dehydrogenase
MINNDLRRIRLVLLGVGGVGGDLIRQIITQRDYHARQYGLTLELHAVFDSRSCWERDPDRPFAVQELEEILNAKKTGHSLVSCGGKRFVSLVDETRGFREKETIFVDCTASDQTVPVLIDALESGFQIVLANKKPLTASQDVYRNLTHNSSQARWETTVGSCLPVITTLNRLNSCGDRVRRMAGTLSGTLGFLMSGLQEGQTFGQLVRNAHRDGATEPDPRDDLSGMDVARKALILARGIGLELEMSDVKVDGLLPDEERQTSIERFLSGLDRLNSSFESRMKAALQKGRTLRYLAVVEKGCCSVGLFEIPLQSPLGQLKGNDNLLEIHSRIFNPQPLVIQGRGAGVEATAAGVLSDVIELALNTE